MAVYQGNLEQQANDEYLRERLKQGNCKLNGLSHRFEHQIIHGGHLVLICQCGEVKFVGFPEKS